MRPALIEYFLKIANVVATRSTCSRRQVGAVITDGYGYLLSTGYNGVPKGQPHCIDTPCAGVAYPVGEGLDVCRAQHAEVNAITHCRDLQSASILYCTTSPCMSCAKLIGATNINIVYYEGDIYDEEAIQYLRSIGALVYNSKEVNQ